MSLGAFTTMAFLTKNSFLDEIRKQYVMTARAKGLSEREVLYGHVFRNAMLIIIAGFPGAFISAFFSGALLIETIFSLDGLGLLGFESVDQARLSGRVRHALHLRADGSGGESRLRLHLHARRSAHRLREPGGLSRWTSAPRDAAAAGAAAAQEDEPAPPPWLIRALGLQGRFDVSPHQPAPLAQLQGEPARLLEPDRLSSSVRLVAVCRVARQRPADHR